MEHLTDLEALLLKIWQRIERGALVRRDPFHFPVVGTVGSDGCSIRTMVLRAASQLDRTLVFHVDLRSPKIAQIRLNPKVAIHFYSHEEKFQLRLQSFAKISTDDEIAEWSWQKTALIARRIYCGKPPGLPSPVPDPGYPEHLRERAPTQEESEAGRANFAVISCEVFEIDYLCISQHGHIRARFLWKGGNFSGAWLTP